MTLSESRPIRRMKAADGGRDGDGTLVVEELNRFTDNLYRAETSTDVYEAALDTITCALGCSRASILLFDDAGIMRFAAWRGLSDAYRRAVEGHSIAAAFWEWVRPGSGSTCGVALATGDRSIVPDIELSDFMAGSEDLEAYRQTGIRAVQSTPLLSRTGRLLGMISTHWRNPHQPSQRDLRLLDVLARQAADLIERTQAEETGQRLTAIVDSSLDAIVSKDLNGIVTTWNRGAERLFGYTADEMIGRSITTLIPPDRQFEEIDILERVRRAERVDHYEAVRRRKDGSLVDISLTVSPVKDATGKVVGASKIARDISEKKEAQARRDEPNPYASRDELQKTASRAFIPSLTPRAIRLACHLQSQQCDPVSSRPRPLQCRDIVRLPWWPAQC